MILSGILKTDSRTGKMLRNIFAMGIFRFVTMAISLLYVPLLLNSMDKVNYSVWLTLTSVVAWMSMLDIGLGNGLRNKLAESIAAGDIRNARIYISSSYVMLALIMAAVVVFALLFSRIVPWHVLLNVEKGAIPGLDWLCVIVLISFALQFILGLINSILYALQVPAYSYLITLCSQGASFCVVLLAVLLWDVRSLFILGTLISAVPIAVTAIFTVYLFRRQYRRFMPSFRLIDFRMVSPVLTLGMKFFVLQIITIVLFQTNNLVIAHTVSADAVVEYNIAYKYLSILAIAYMVFVTPVWSATTDAIARKDYEWMRRTLAKLHWLLFGASAAGIVMWLAAPPIYRFWLRSPDVSITSMTTLLVMLSTLARSGYSNYGYMINGSGKVFLQLVLTGIAAIIYIPAVWAAGRHFGLNGILYVNIAVFLFNMLWSGIQAEKIINGTAYGIWNR